MKPEFDDDLVLKQKRPTLEEFQEIERQRQEQERREQDQRQRDQEQE